MTANFRGNNTDLLRGATEVAAFLTDWSFLIDQHNSDASVRCDGPSHADRLIRVGSV
jgi:hypothetical protein